MLAEWRARERLSMYAAARKLGVAWGSYQAWETGKGRPNLDFAVKIEAVTGIAPAAWVEAAA